MQTGHSGVNVKEVAAWCCNLFTFNDRIKDDANLVLAATSRLLLHFRFYFLGDFSFFLL